MKNGRTQAKDLPEAALLAALDRVQGKMQREDEYWASLPRNKVWGNLWMLLEELPEFPHKVVLAKLKHLVQRRVLDGCTCGCRGDFYLR